MKNPQFETTINLFDYLQSDSFLKENILDTWNAEHIYTDIERFCFSIFSTEDQMVIYTLYKKIENCLLAYRNNKYLMASIISAGFLFPEKIKNSIVADGMYSLYFAMEAYGDYCNLQYLKAQEKLDSAIMYALTQSKTIPRFSLVVCEQWYNKIKTSSKVEDGFDVLVFKKSINGLMKYNYSGIFNNENFFSADFKKEKFVDIDNMIIHNVNRILELIERLPFEKSVLKSIRDVFFCEMLGIANYYDFQKQYTMTKVLSSIFDCNGKIFNTFLFEDFDLLRIMPRQIKKEFLEMVKINL